ncbi:MAG TPA: LuxR family transcriptional regulator [Nocardioides sp.]|nr:LuxR family transcriptional regulator [Nocardioides sp.]
MTTHQPDRRDLFEAQAAPLYDEIVADGGIKADDPRIADDAPQRSGFDLLVELGLVQFNQPEETWLPEDPTSVQSRVVTPLSQEGVQLLEESSKWAQSFGPLTHAWRRASFTQSRGPFTYLHGGEAIDAQLATLVAEAEEEMLTAQPQGSRSGATLARAAQRDVQMLERGTKMRTLYQHSARRSSITHKYVAAVTARGAEVRTLDEFFNRMIVIDRRVAVIPNGDELSVAVVIREPAMVAYLVDVFERAWERGRLFTNRERTMMAEIAAEQRAMTIRMLIEGHSDPVSAKRLGVSPRTYAGYVADLKVEYEAETRFQLGYMMGRRGVSGTENSED